MKVYVYKDMMIRANSQDQADNAYTVLTGKKRTASLCVPSPGPGMIEKSVDATKTVKQLEIGL